MALGLEGFDLGFELPEISTAGLGFWVVLILAILVFAAVGILIVWMVFQRKIYNKKIVLFENTGQGYHVAGKDRARTIKVGNGGDELLFLKKRKVYRTAYGRKMGKNEIWFAVGQDGYWYNCILGDLDAKMGMLDIEPIDRDMRAFHVAATRNIMESYGKQTFMQKYGVLVISSIFLLVMIIAIWLLMSKAGDLIEAAKPVAEALTFAAEEMTKAVGSLDVVYSGGSGITPAG